MPLYAEPIPDPDRKHSFISRVGYGWLLFLFFIIVCLELWNERRIITQMREREEAERRRQQQQRNQQNQQDEQDEQYEEYEQDEQEEQYHQYEQDQQGQQSSEINNNNLTQRNLSL